MNSRPLRAESEAGEHCFPAFPFPRVPGYNHDMDRKELRKEMISRVKAFQGKAEESSEIVEMIRSSRQWQEAETILAFHPLPSEPDISPLLEDKRILLPYIEDGVMRFSSSRKLSLSAFGFMEPEHVEEGFSSALMLVPLLAYNGHYRLGRGGGFYDRYIAENRERLLTAGVAFSVSYEPRYIPAAHDERLDMIFSPLDGNPASQAWRGK